MIARFPLAWPSGWPTHRGKHEYAPYSVRYQAAIDDMLNEIRLLGGTQPIVSSNAPIRKSDGLPYTEAAEEVRDDPGVAVYFTLDKKPTVIACDKWFTVRDNIRAIGLTVAGLRAIKRAGASELFNRAFIGFKALPGPRSCWEVLGIPPKSPASTIAAAYRKLAAERHPDHGGSSAEMTELNVARDQALAEVEP